LFTIAQLNWIVDIQIITYIEDKINYFFFFGLSSLYPEA